MSLANAVKILSTAAQAKIKTILGKAGATLTEAGGFVATPATYLKAHWEPLVWALAVGAIIGGVAGVWL